MQPSGDGYFQLCSSKSSFRGTTLLTLSLTGVGPFGPSLPYMQITINVLKVRYRQKIGIPQAGS
jgi:hypothetical protein